MKSKRSSYLAIMSTCGLITGWAVMIAASLLLKDDKSFQFGAVLVIASFGFGMLVSGIALFLGRNLGAPGSNIRASGDKGGHFLAWISLCLGFTLFFCLPLGMTLIGQKNGIVSLPIGLALFCVLFHGYFPDFREDSDKRIR